MRKSIKYSIVAGALGIATIATFGVGSVMAQAGISNPIADTFRGQVFDRVISKLNLNVTSDQLKAAFNDSVKEERQSQYKTSLDDAVKSGKISQEIADNALKIENARQTYMESQPKLTKDEMDNLTRAELRIKMQENLENMEKAIEDNTGLSEEQIQSVEDSLRSAKILQFGPHRKGHPGNRGMKGGRMMEY